MIRVGDEGEIAGFLDYNGCIAEVVWDRKFGGHSLDGKCEDGYGWNVRPYSIESIEPLPTINESELFEIINR